LLHRASRAQSAAARGQPAEGNSTAPCCCAEQRAGARCRAVPWQGARGLAPWPGRSSTAPCFSTRTAPEQPGSAWQHGAVLLCRAQRQPERNSPGAVRCPARFSFWALFGPFWPRRAPRGARPPANCMSTQGRGSKQGPVFLSPAPLRPWQGPAWPFQKASGCEGAVLERGRAPLARGALSA
jgi:hypothetical protein